MLSVRMRRGMFVRSLQGRPVEQGKLCEASSHMQNSVSI